MSAGDPNELAIRNLVLMATLVFGYACLFFFMVRRGWLTPSQMPVLHGVSGPELAAWKEESAHATTVKAASIALTEVIVDHHLPQELPWWRDIKQQISAVSADVADILPGRGQDLQAGAFGTGTWGALGASHALRYSASLAETIFADESLGSGSFAVRLCAFLRRPDAKQKLHAVCASAGIPRPYRSKFVDSTMQLQAACD